MVPALAQMSSDTDRCTPVLKSSRKSQSLRNISGARCHRWREEGVQRSKSRYSWHRGGLRYNAFGRARFPGCAEVVLLGRSHKGVRKTVSGQVYCDRSGVVVRLGLGLASGWSG
jgi:hypothetical protein